MVKNQNIRTVNNYIKSLHAETEYMSLILQRLAFASLLKSNLLIKNQCCPRIEDTMSTLTEQIIHVAVLTDDFYVKKTTKFFS